MNKKKVLDYDPKTGFGNFAEIMNANNAIDMAQNKVNTGMAPVTAPVANPAAPNTGVPSLSGGVAADLGGDETADRANESGATVSEQIPTVSGGETESGAVSGGATDTGDGTGIGTNVGTGVGTGASVSAATGVTARPITSTPFTSGPEQSEADWYAAQGLDPDKDYNEAKAALEYDYETSMATYGRRAEELYQMGLSNSGVSDIYQLGAFNAYLAAQNDLAYQRIEAKKKNKQAYLAYDKEYQAGVKADTANAYNFALEQFDYEMDSEGNFTTNNAKNIRAQLLSQGYDKTVVDNVMNMLNALDPASLPTEKAQAEERKKAQEEANAKAELKSMLTTIAFNAYDGNNIGEVEALLAQQSGVDSQMIADIITEIKSRDVSGSTAYKKKLEADVNEVNKLVADIGDTYDSSKEQSIKNLYSDWANIIIDNEGTTKLDLLIEKLNGYNTVAKPSEKEMVEEAINAIYAANKDFVYDGKQTTKDWIKQSLGIEYEDVYDKVIDKMDEDRKVMASAAVTDAVGKDVGEATIDELDSAFASISESYDKDSEEYKAKQDAVSTKIDETVKWALEEKNIGKAGVGAVFGYNADEWAKLDDGEREAAILETLGNCVKNGSLTQEAYNTQVKTWLEGELDKYIEEDKGNAQATGFRDAGSVVYTLMEWKDEGYMSEDDYKNRIGDVIEKMKFDRGLTWNGMDEISWYKTVEGSEGSVHLGAHWGGASDKYKDVYDISLKDAPKMRATGTDYIAEYNGSLYHIRYKNSGPVWEKDANFDLRNVEYINKLDKVSGLSFAGDGVGTAYDYEKIGMYEIVVYMLQNPTQIEKNRVPKK